MSSSRKKVIVRTVQDELQTGYLPTFGIVSGDSVNLLDLDGRVLAIPSDAVRWIAFVRDFNLTDKVDPERLTRRIFLARPRTEGLWVRLTLLGGDDLEGLAPLDLSLLDGLVDDGGLYLIPPDVRSNTQRLYVPRTVIKAVKLLAVITSPSQTKSHSKSQVKSQTTSVAAVEGIGVQPSLFPEPRP